MLSIETAAYGLAGAASLMIVWIALQFRSNPSAALHSVEHLEAALPWVMAGRYLAFALLSIAATLYGDLSVIAGLFGVFAVLGFFDTVLYSRLGAPVFKHLTAGLGALVVAAVAFIAEFGLAAS